MKKLTQVLATGAIASLLLPTLAFAHEGKTSVNFEQHLTAKIEKKFDQAGKHEARKDARATTAAAAITAKAVRVQKTVDVFASFDARLGAAVASSSNAVALTAKFNDYKTNATSAKVEAGKAIAGAAQVSTANSTSTNAALLVQAKVDLKESKGFLQDAKKLFMQILRSLWN